MKKLGSLYIGLILTSIAVAQNVGVGTSTPNATLDVNGTFKLADGTQGDGKVLTSDSNGLASWQSSSTSETYYPSVNICCQSWMTKNLDVSTYRNGDPIPKVTDATEWAALTTGAYCYYNNDSATYAAVYGKLYNWYAVNDPRGIAPYGWHIPSDHEWNVLGDCFGGNGAAGSQLKELGTTHWALPNSGANNYSNFTALPGGIRWLDGTFDDVTYLGIFWTATESDTDNAWMRDLTYITGAMERGVWSKVMGFSVRCIRD